MLPEQAKQLATLMVGRFGGGDPRMVLYVSVLKDLDFVPASEAVNEFVMGDREKAPSPNQMIGAYYGARNAARAKSEDGPPPCHFCREEGRANPFPATAPYLATVTIKTDDGKVLGPAWGHPPACAGHGLKVSREKGHNGYEPPRVKEHRDEIRQWRDRCEAEHAEWAAKRIEDELARSHPTPTVAATRAFVDAAVSAPIPASAVAVAPDFQSPTETEQKNDHFSGSPLPPMTPEEEAAFDAGISF